MNECKIIVLFLPESPNVKEIGGLRFKVDPLDLLFQLEGWGREGTIPISKTEVRK